ncbi:MAG: hypothetical protein P8Y62_06500 [candidate division WOR-3 bacterium]|jgi:hypothetical protein
MQDIKNKIKEDVINRYAGQTAGKITTNMFLDEKIYEEGDVLNVVDQEIRFEKPGYFIFVDEQPGYNWGHSCKYYIYDASTGTLIKEISSSFPPFFNKETPETYKMFKSG